MIGTVLDAASWMLLVAGGLFCVVGAVGLLRMPDLFTRMHAASVIDTAGLGLIVLGLILQAGFTIVALKLVAILAIYLFASPVATHAQALAALHRGLKPLLAGDKETRSSNS